MGIVNVTPDSFSGDGIEEPHAAAEHAAVQARDADIVDIGAESTRPGHISVDARTECARLLPVLRIVRERLPHVILSVDTYKPDVLLAAVAEGADMLNSVQGMPPALLDAAAEAGVPVVIMHNRSDTNYEGAVIDEVLRFLNEAASRAVKAGLPPERVILDPGIGFGKTADQNIAVLHDLAQLKTLGFPLMLGTSRKSTLGKLTGRAPAERVFGTAATTALAVAAGVDIVRVHDVQAAVDVVRVSDAIVRGWRPARWT